MFLNITIDNVLGISNEIELKLIAESKRSSKKETVYNISILDQVRIQLK